MLASLAATLIVICSEGSTAFLLPSLSYRSDIRLFLYLVRLGRRSTLMMQVITDVFDFGYLSNAHCRYFGCPRPWLSVFLLADPGP